MPATTQAITGHKANCPAATDHFIACRGSKPATRIRARFDRISQADAFATNFGDSRTMNCAVIRYRTEDQAPGRVEARETHHSAGQSCRRGVAQDVQPERHVDNAQR